MTLSIQGIRLDVSDTLREFVQDKLTDALRVLGDAHLDAVAASVALEHTAHRYREHGDVCTHLADVTLSIRGTVFRAEASADSIEAAVVEVKHELTRQLRDWRKRVRDARRSGARSVKRGPDLALDADTAYIDSLPD